jgi:hypothetical protein
MPISKKAKVQNPEVLNLDADMKTAAVKAGLDKAAELIRAKIGDRPPTIWAPLKPSTIADRKRKGYSAGPPLYRTGRLRSQLIQGQEIYTGGAGGELYSDDQVAETQDKTRPIYDLSEEEEAAVAAAMLEALEGSW